MSIGTRISDMTALPSLSSGDEIPLIRGTTNYRFDLGAKFALYPTSEALTAPSGASLVGTINAFANARLLDLQTRLSYLPLDIREFTGYDPNAIDTALGYAMEAAGQKGGYVMLPAGLVKHTAPIEFWDDGVIIAGQGSGATQLAYIGTNGPGITNPERLTVARQRCAVKGLRYDATGLTGANKVVIDWASFQFGVLSDLDVRGSDAGCWNIFLASGTYGVTECTYNVLDHIYMGLAEVGVRLDDGANDNFMIDCRAQIGVAGGRHAEIVTSAGNAPNNNHFLKFSCEHPGQVSAGIVINAGDGNSVAKSRFEGPSVGVTVGASATNTNLEDNYFSGVATEVANSSTTTIRKGKGSITFGTGSALSRYEKGTFTPTVTGGTSAGTPTYGTTRGGSYEVVGETCCIKELTVEITNHTGTGQIVIGGLPVAVKNVSDRNIPMAVLADSLTYSGTLRAVAIAGTNEIRLFSETSGAAIAQLEMDTAFKVRISGHYPI